MRSRSRVAAWIVGLTVSATLVILGCGGGDDDGGPQLNAVAFGDGLFVAVGETPDAYANPGPGWTPFPTGVPSLNGVAYDPQQGVFVAVGDGGAIVTSTDGVAWTQQGSPTGFNLNGVADGDGVLIAVGDGGTILTSTDATSWQIRPSGTDATLNAVAFGPGGLVVAVGAFGIVPISNDLGLTWQLTDVGLTNDLFGVAYGAGSWVTVGQAGIVLQGESPTDWQVIGDNVLPNLNDVTFLQGLFFVVGDNGNVLTSPDGVNYGASVSNTGQFLYGSAYGNGSFFVVGTGGRAIQSGDGAIFQDRKI